MEGTRATRVRAGAAALLVVLVVVVIAVAVAVGSHHPHDAAPTRAAVDLSAGSPAASPTPPRPARRTSLDPGRIRLDLGARSTTDPSSIWVVVNKKHPIQPLDFRPATAIVRGYQVARPAAAPLGALLDAGDAAGLGLKIESAFRSHDYQVHVHDSLVGSVGQEAADRVSARPGYSEHQTGLAVDLITPGQPGCDFEQCFATTPAGRWLGHHAWRYGFLVRYTAGDRRITGYQPEPWHIRYVGRPLAAAMRRAGVATLERVFGITGGGYRRESAETGTGSPPSP